MKNSTRASWLAIPALLIGVSAIGQTNSAQRSPATSDAVAPDNSKTNRLDTSNRAATPDEKKNNAADLDLVKRIRQSVMADKDLSTYGHNVKIVAVNGTVTLNGVVRNADEKTRIGQKAVAIAGKMHVVDDLKVASTK
jgi:hyperosmotically inducible protein